MTTHDVIPSKRDPNARPLDRNRRCPTVAPMTPDDEKREAHRRVLLRQQPWGRLLAQLTAIALKRVHGRSTADAQDYAQEAIAGAYEPVARGGWDPDRGPLVSYLVARVITAAAGERRRKRTTCEVWLDQEVEEDGEEQGLSVHEKHLADDKPAPDAALHRLRFASTFEDRLVARLAGDAAALEVLAFMKEGLFTPTDLAVATGKSPRDAVVTNEIKDTLRRVRYHARELTKELSTQAVIAPTGSPRQEKVMQ